MFVLFIVAFLGLLWIGAHVGIVFLKSSGILGKIGSSIPYVIALIMPLLMAGSMLVGNGEWNSINSIVYTFSSTWIVILSGFFFSTVLIWFISAVLQKLGISFPAAYSGYIVLILTVTFAGYGITNASNIKIKNTKLSEGKLPSELSNKRIALISDLHIGLVRKKYFVAKVTRKIMKEKPDMILIAGDLIDGPKFPYQEFLSPLSELSAPLGVYFTPGNHEGYNTENELFYAAIPKNITVVIDEVVSIPGTSQTLVGFDYLLPEDEVMFKDRIDVVTKGSKPSIAILHDPKNRGSLGKAGIPLTVSGHTHGGQFFPGTLMVKLLYKEKISGLVEHITGDYYTTTGVGTAVSPARVGTDAEIVILES